MQIIRFVFNILLSHDILTDVIFFKVSLLVKCMVTESDILS